MAYELGIAEAELLLVWLPGNNEVSWQNVVKAFVVPLQDKANYYQRSVSFQIIVGHIL